MANRPKYAEEFFNDLLEPIEYLSTKHPYVSFLPLCVLIELLGQASINSSEWNRGKPEKNFNKGLEVLGKKYEDNKVLLREVLRNGFAHSFITKGKIAITHKKSSYTKDKHHLDIIDGKLIVISQVLFEDLKVALIKSLINIDPLNTKMINPIMHVPME